jgi:hypothetical protein
LINAFKGPVILAASGPFLEEAADTIRHASSNIPIMALVPSVPYLQSCGITPDFVVSTDAGFWNRYRFVRHCRIPLITTFSAEPTLVRSWEGARYLFSHALPVEGLFSTIASESLTQTMQGTASLVMLSLARRMGFSPFYVAGYDFSFTGLKDHVSGAGFDAMLHHSSTRMQTWETIMLRRLHGERLAASHDNRGAAVLSTHKLLLYRNWLEREVDLTGVLRLNRGAAVRGLKMAHLTHVHEVERSVRVSFQDALKKLPRLPLQRMKYRDDAREIFRHLEMGRDASTLIRLHTRLFGAGAESAGGQGVKSDLNEARLQLSALLGKSL